MNPNKWCVKSCFLYSYFYFLFFFEMSSYWSPAAFRCSQARCHYHHTGACFVCKQVWRRSWNVHESAAAAAAAAPLNSRISCPVPLRDGTEWESCQIDVDSFTSWCLREKKKSIKKMTRVGFFIFPVVVIFSQNFSPSSLLFGVFLILPPGALAQIISLHHSHW